MANKFQLKVNGTMVFGNLLSPISWVGGKPTSDIDGDYTCRLRIAEAEKIALEKSQSEFLDTERATKKATLTNSKSIKLADESPIKPAKDEKGELVAGFWDVTAKQHAAEVKYNGGSFRPSVDIFDTYGKEWDKEIAIYGGSKLQVILAPYVWHNPAKGMGWSYRLVAVAVKELVTGGKRTAKGYGFDLAEGAPATPEQDEVMAEGDFMKTLQNMRG
jgi:hypothetical protein